MESKEISKFVERVLRNQETRIEVVKRSPIFFLITFLSKHIQCELAPMHYEMLRLMEDEKIPLAVVTAFRGSGKTTLMNTAYALWGVLGVQQKKFILIVSRTQQQARDHFADIRSELESNPLLKKDLGPFQEDFTWNTGALVIPKYGAKIMAVSQEQKVRGLKFGSHRPDLLLVDDIEESESVKTSENRDKIYRWFTDEILPLGTSKTKTVVLGNLLHNDSLVCRLQTQINAGERSGVYRQFPIQDDDGKVLWPGRYPDKASLEAEKKRIGDSLAWKREYLLIVADDRKPVIEKSWLHYYKDLPIPRRNEGHAYVLGVDPAFSENTKADNTAIVSAFVLGSGNDRKMFILPNPVNEKLQMPDTIKRIKLKTKTFSDKINHKVYVEEVGTQLGLVQQLQYEGVKAVGIRFGGSDKRSRLADISNLIKEGKIIFCDHGNEEVIYQALNFGSTRYDDLCDALTTLIIGVWQDPPTTFVGPIVARFDMDKWLRGKNRNVDRGSGGGGWSIEFGPDGKPYRRY
ncbi:MAG: hypothetical protein M1355_04400 [Patescibacteria group bacterium]|nr:hypothetical protein [Patescibacteria group bacterium]